MLPIKLTDKDWERIKTLLPKRQNGPGRPRQNDRKILDALLWLAHTKQTWRELPDHFPPFQTCNRRYHEWKKLGFLDKVIRLYLPNDFECCWDLTEFVFADNMVIADPRYEIKPEDLKRFGL